MTLGIQLLVSGDDNHDAHVTGAKLAGTPPSTRKTGRVDHFQGQPHTPPPLTCTPLAAP